MRLDEAITRYKNNAEYERTHGNLQGCLEFRQLAEWLKDYKRMVREKVTIDEHIAHLKKLKSFHNGSYGANINFALDIIRKYQKIQEIIADWKSDGGAFEMSEPYWLRLISEVIEDGNNAGND